MTDSYLQVSDLRLSYPLQKGRELLVLNIEKFIIGKGMTVGLMGPSGSGKTSLLHVLAGIEEPQKGTVQWDGIEITKLSSIEQDRWRHRNIGFVFQDFHLIPRLTPLENVLLPAYFQYARPPHRIKSYAEQLLKEVGMDKCSVLIERLSRGEKQRVAIARALIMSPHILLADEPTGSLDRETADAIVELLLRISKETGTTLITASHDPFVINRFSQSYTLFRGELIKTKIKEARDV